MPVLMREAKSCLYIHIPKTGGSAFTENAKRAGWTLIFSVNGIRSNAMPFSKITPQHFHARLLRDVFDLAKFDTILTIVRDPFSRFRSEYYWQLASEQTALEPSDWIPAMFELQRTSQSAHDNHLRPQTEFIPDEVPVQIFKLEEGGVAAATKHLFEFGQDSFIKRLQAKSGGENVAKISRRREEIDTVFEDHYEDIRAFYSKDFDQLGYVN